MLWLSVQAVDAYAEACRDLACGVAPLRYLLNRCNREFFYVLLSAHAFCLCATLWLRSAYHSLGDSNLNRIKRMLGNLLLTALSFDRLTSFVDERED